jgi:hypothetical protein
MIPKVKILGVNIDPTYKKRGESCIATITFTNIGGDLDCRIGFSVSTNSPTIGKYWLDAPFKDIGIVRSGQTVTVDTNSTQPFPSDEPEGYKTGWITIRDRTTNAVADGGDYRDDKAYYVQIPKAVSITSVTWK